MMCKVCRQEPCDTRCPNAEEVPLICSDCGDAIEYGMYCNIQGIEYICENCLMDMSGFDLAERLGITEIMFI